MQRVVKTSYNPIEVHWSEIPGRDEKWKQETIANTSQEQFNREFECEFLGSINTLIHPTKIKSMVFDDPIQRNAGLELYKKPEKGRTYTIVCDVARGTEQDYSAFLYLMYQNFLIVLLQNIVITKSNPYCFQM